MMTALQQLEAHLRELASDGLCVAFSGGVDSAVLLAACRRVCDNVHAVTLYTPLHTPAEPADARKLAQSLGARHAVLRVDEIPESIVDNPRDRCYLCKRDLFTRILNYAADKGITVVLDGTNADDRQVYRPGLRALQELGVHSPLAELGFNKGQVREMARELDLAVAGKPSAPCLATRFPYGTHLTRDLLQRVQDMEQFLRDLRFYDVRVRIHGDLARIEVPTDSFGRLLEHREQVAQHCKRCGCTYCTMDLVGLRSGSMDEKPDFELWR